MILLVDDDATILGTSQMMLEALGYKVMAVNSGSKAILEIQSNSTQYRLILTDLSMPDMDGRELVIKLREVGYEGPAVCISGYIMEESDLGDEFAGFLMKPFRLADLKKSIETYMEQ